MKTAIIAASRAKYYKIHSAEDPQLDQESLRNELYTARKLKLESKLVSKTHFFSSWDLHEDLTTTYSTKLVKISRPH